MTATATSRFGLPVSTRPRRSTDPPVATTDLSVDSHAGNDPARYPFGEQLQNALQRAAHLSGESTGGLPLPRPPLGRRAGTAHAAVAVMDGRGRLGDRSALRLLGWQPGDRLMMSVISGILVVVSTADGPFQVTRQGHLRLPADIRHTCHLVTGDRQLIIACPQPALLLVCPPPAVDAMLLAYVHGLGRVQS